MTVFDYIINYKLPNYNNIIYYTIYTIIQHNTYIITKFIFINQSVKINNYKMFKIFLKVS